MSMRGLSFRTGPSLTGRRSTFTTELLGTASYLHRSIGATPPWKFVSRVRLRYTARLEVHLDQRTQTTITPFITAFRRRQSMVLRHVLDWRLSHGQGWKIDRSRPLGRAEHASLRLEPERLARVEAVATAA